MLNAIAGLTAMRERLPIENLSHDYLGLPAGCRCDTHERSGDVIEVCLSVKQFVVGDFFA